MNQFKKIFTLILAISSPAVFSQPKLPCTDNTRECIISAATAYLDALVSHDACGVPLADDAKRWENGINTGTNAENIRYKLRHDAGLKSIKEYRDVRWVVDGNQAVASYLLDIIIPYTNIYVATTHVTERFEVNNGLIKEIEAVFCSSATMFPENSRMGESVRRPILCNRSLV